MNENYPKAPILMVDDEKEFLNSVSLKLKSVGINNLVECQQSKEVPDLLSRETFSAILLDLLMPEMNGNELLPYIAEEHPNIPVIIITAINEIETAVSCLKSGAFDYIVKPVDGETLVKIVRQAISFWEIKNENYLLKKYLLSDELENPDVFKEIITGHKKIRSIFQYIETIGGTSFPVLLTGETGVGKELFARAIHRISKRKGKLVPVNIAGLDDTLFSDTLFGHKKGSFTGADKDRKGLIDEAKDGTIFLDEIGDMSPQSQVKLLRLIQESKYYQLGSDIQKISNTRIITATNRDLEEAVKAGTFRRDLYYRLKTHHVYIPPLRERKEDIPLLVEHFMEKVSMLLNKKKPTSPRELFTILKNYHFPGNIRELESLISDAVSSHKGGILSLGNLKEKVLSQSSGREVSGTKNQDDSRGDTFVFPDKLPSLKEMSKIYIYEVLERVEGNQSIAAKILGLTREALNRRLKRMKV